VKHFQGSSSLTRRRFISSVLQTSAGILCAAPAVKSFAAAPGIVRLRPAVTHGVMSGEVDADSAVIWSRADQRSRMVVEWATTESFKNSRHVRGGWTGEENDFTAKVVLDDLPAGQRIFYRVRFDDERFTSSPAELGQFVTASGDDRDVFFAWSGDTCGQGYGINAQFGGLKTYEAMRQLRPDFFIHSGDNIYADGVVEPEMRINEQLIWRNLTTPEKSKAAETLAEFRGNYRYNLFDANVRRFYSEVPIFSQWDDHEVMNNWYWERDLTSDKKYKVKDIRWIAKNATRAFWDYMPLHSGWRQKIFRTVDRGPLCEIFMLDERSFRGPNTPNRQTKRSHDTDFLGRGQLAWLKDALLKSKAVWKVIASDMPLSIAVGDGKDKEGRNVYEAVANGENGIPTGREMEVADLLSFMKRNKIRNTFWLTADVHFAASLHYDPMRAKFKEFDPFWEFISGPLHAASLAPGGLDGTFGSEFKWTSRPKGAKASGPYTKEQFFSTVRIDAKSKVATITHLNRDGEKLSSVDLEPVFA
jgi:alkaline phosphatase D